MSDAAEELPPSETPPKRAVKRRRKAPRRKADVVPFKAPDEFAGMTKLKCCSACVPEKCVISGIGYCMHPLKSGTQSISDPVVVARYGRAKKVLEHQRIDLSKDVV